VLADSIPIEIGRYDAAEVRVFLNSSRHRALVGELHGGW